MHPADTLLQEIVGRVLEVGQPDRIILFGSAARGQMTRDSDIDLLVLEASPEQPRQESVRLRNALRGLGYPFDVMVMATERFEETKEIIGGLAYPAYKYGRVLYEAGGALTTYLRPAEGSDTRSAQQLGKR